MLGPLAMTTGCAYSLKTLNGNWFEDRRQPPGSFAAVGTERTTRKVEPEIANVGTTYDVLTRIARSTPRESYALADDGFNEKQTLHHADYAHPMTRKEVVRNPPEPPNFITTETVPEVCYEDRRPIPGNVRGFGAVLNRHEEGHNQRFWATAFGDTFGECDRRRRPRQEASGLRPAGVSVLEMTHKCGGLRAGLLCGEDFRDNSDPSNDTHTQRSWLYGGDPALRHLTKGGTPRGQLPPKDNELSLPVGEMLSGRGKRVQDCERAFRVRSDITKGKGERPGVSIFQDESLVKG